MTILKCKICGGDLETRAGMTVGTCGACGSLVTLPTLDDDKRTNLYNRAGQIRRAYEYDRASVLYENILAEDAGDAEAYWSLVLCKFGVEYVEDPINHKMVPTCNRTQIASIFTDEDYRQAVAHAEGEARFLYEEEALRIDAIQQGILAISGRETTPFDVFICYKETDERGRRAEESFLAQEIYDELTSNGYRVFFARVTLADKLGEAYEPYIFAALNSSSVMLVVGAKAARFSAVWVKNEWSRYLALIKAGARKTLIPVYKGISPAEMPDELRQLQGLDMGQPDSMRNLTQSVRKIVGSAAAVSRRTVLVESESALRLSENGSEALCFTGEPGDTLIIPDGVASIAPGAFAGLVSLETAVLPDGMTSIASGAFRGCSGLKNLALPDSLEIIEGGAFAGCSAMEYLHLGESVRAVGEDAFSGCSELEDMSFPYEGLKSIGARAFEGCCPKKIDLPRSLEAIGERAFADCASLEEITLPLTLRSVGENAFAGCYALRRVTLTEGIGGNDKIPPYSNWGGGEFSAARPEIVIADYVKNVGEDAFAGCDYLVRITIPRSVRSIGRNAFAGCAALRYVNIEDGELQSVSEGAFAGCAALKGIALPSRLAFIGRNAFAGCALFRGLTFPVALKTVEEGAFSGCAGLEKITVKTSKRLDYAAMGLNDEGLSLTVNADCYICDKAFAGFTAMKSVTLNKGTENIAAGAFQNCAGLAKLKLPSGLKSVGNFAFAGCAGLTGEVEFPPEITDIGNSSFAGCVGLESVTIPPRYNCTIGKNAFAGCIELKSVNFVSDSHIDIKEGAFSGCGSLRELSIPQAAVGRRAFADCGGLTRVIITGKYTSLDDGVFEGCDRLTEVSFADGGEYAGKFDLTNIFAGTPYAIKGLSGVCPKCGTRIRRGGKCEKCGLTALPISNRLQSGGKQLRTILFVFTATLIYMIASHFFVRWIK
jgi:hypothetical protein